LKGKGEGKLCETPSSTRGETIVMTCEVNYRFAGLAAALLVILLPSFTAAQDFEFSVSPAEVHVDRLPPGETAEFKLTICNKDEIGHLFTFTIFQPTEEQRREERAEFPDNNWISFSSQDIEIAPNDEADVTVTAAVPREQRWADKDWETWLGVTAESSDLLATRLYVRLLVSTSGTVKARFNAGLVAGIIAVIILLGCGGYYYFRRKTKPG
jgi:hypothetical protein